MSSLAGSGRSRETLGLILGLIGMIVFAGTMPAARTAVLYLDPGFITALRSLFAAIPALAIFLMLRTPWPRRWSDWRMLTLTALCLVLGFPLLTTIALVTVPASHAAIVLGILPLATAAAATLLIGERPSARFWAASAIGCALVVTFALRQSDIGALVAGDLLLLAAMVICAIGYALSGLLSQRLPGWQVIGWTLIAALPATLIATIVLMPPADVLARVPLGGWVAVGYLALGSQLIAFIFLNVGFALGGVARVGQVQLVQPFVGVSIAAWINDEAVTLEMLLFTTAVVVVVLAGRRTRVARPASSEIDAELTSSYRRR